MHVADRHGQNLRGCVQAGNATGGLLQLRPGPIKSKTASGQISPNKKTYIPELRASDIRAAGIVPVLTKLLLQHNTAAALDLGSKSEKGAVVNEWAPN